MKDTRSFLLVMLSVGLVGTWVYHLYDKTQYSHRKTEVYIKDSVAVAEGIRDSLQKIYTYTISNLDTRLDSTRTSADSLKTQLNVKLNEIFKLKSEIDGILKNSGASKADMDIARGKIAELQTLIEDLKGEKNSMEEEKKQLNNILSQLSGEITGLQENMKRLGDENKTLTEKVNLASLFVTSEVKLMPVTVKNDKEQETNQAKKVSKFVISFTVQNNVNDYPAAEIYIVILQPNGKVLKSDVWDAFSMETFNGAKISYTRKVRFEYAKGEAKHEIFSLNADEYDKGNYTVQIFHNGYLVGQTMKTLL